MDEFERNHYLSQLGWSSEMQPQQFPPQFQGGYQDLMVVPDFFPPGQVGTVSQNNYFTNSSMNFAPQQKQSDSDFIVIESPPSADDMVIHGTPEMNPSTPPPPRPSNEFPTHRKCNSDISAFGDDTPNCSPCHSRNASKNNLKPPGHSRSRSIEVNFLHRTNPRELRRGHSRSRSIEVKSSQVQETLPSHHRSRSSEMEEILQLISWKTDQHERVTAPKVKRESCTKESQQEKHKTAEKKRRNDMNELIERLKNLLPPSDSKDAKMTKLAVLQDTAEYLCQVQDLCVKLLRENKNVTSDKEKLLKEINELKNSVLLEQKKRKTPSVQPTPMDAEMPQTNYRFQQHFEC